MTDQYFLGRVTIGSTTTKKPNTAVPKEYQDIAKYSVKLNPRDFPSQPYGIML